MIGTGWISEVFPRKGVLTFTSPASGEDERVLFLASKVYIFEKRLGTKQSLDQVPVPCIEYPVVKLTGCVYMVVV
jgi:hypothetical protein